MENYRIRIESFTNAFCKPKLKFFAKLFKTLYDNFRIESFTNAFCKPKLKFFAKLFYKKAEKRVLPWGSTLFIYLFVR